MSFKGFRVISLVPSWTETLIEAGVCVVGRTRFCIHPANAVARIPSVGGTKNLNIAKVLELKPDFVILDEQENTFAMAEQLQLAKIPLLISNVTDGMSAAVFLAKLGAVLNQPQMGDWATRYRQLPNSDPLRFRREITLQGEWPTEPVKKIDYVIWRKPWMVIGQKTFIADSLKRGGLIVTRTELYPEVDESELKKSFCLFSSEPFPFEKDYKKLIAEGFKGVVVDGEKMSWYGIRNLLFLERCL
ncbi:MAG: Fe3+-siderophores ABC transporter protein [Bdellovibrionaceae bacterium]|nr:Fe3+-siderophores ABC transporter protein [Bdellovibrio sp.]